MKLVCPACRGALESRDQGFRCEVCVRDFPCRFGFVDFRLSAVPDVDSEQDQASAASLHDRSDRLSFAELWRLHYDRHPEASQAAHQAHVAHLSIESAQARRVFERIGPSESFLDLGCGTGRWLEAAAEGSRRPVGVDASLAQLVLARAYLRERNVEASLFAAEIESLPFPDGAFQSAAAADVLEHVADPRAAVAEASRILAPGGRFYAAAPNRYSLTPEPHVGVWGLGFLPRRQAERYVQRRFGIDYRSIRPFSWNAFRSAFRIFEGQVEVAPLQPSPAEQQHFSPLKRAATSLYRSFLRIPLINIPVRQTAPAFEAWAQKRSGGQQTAERRTAD